LTNKLIGVVGEIVGGVTGSRLVAKAVTPLIGGDKAITITIAVDKLGPGFGASPAAVETEDGLLAGFGIEIEEFQSIKVYGSSFHDGTSFF
jgi:hypothetical protein